MKVEEAVQKLLVYRAEKYFTPPFDNLGRPLLRNQTNTKRWSKIFDWREDVAGIYGHKPPPGQLSLVRCTPFGQPKTTKFTCENVPFVKDEEVTFQGCKDSKSFVTKHRAGIALQRSLQMFLEQDAYAFASAFLSNVGAYNKHNLDNIPFVKAIFDKRTTAFPNLEVNLKFPIKDLSAEKLLTHIEVIK